MKKIKHVLQEDNMGCGIACLAMVTGKSYEEIKQVFYNDFDAEGMSIQDMITYLGDFGYSIIHKYITNYAKLGFATPEMLTPFADIHVVRIQNKFDSRCGHLVVMDKDGKLYCPSGMTDEEVRKAYAVTDILGLYTIDTVKNCGILKKNESKKK